MLSRASSLLLREDSFPTSRISPCRFSQKTRSDHCQHIFPAKCGCPTTVLKQPNCLSGILARPPELRLVRPSSPKRGQERRLVGNQLCYWISADANGCMKFTHLIVSLCTHLPPLASTFSSNIRPKAKFRSLPPNKLAWAKAQSPEPNKILISLCLTSCTKLFSLRGRQPPKVTSIPLLRKHKTQNKFR